MYKWGVVLGCSVLMSACSLAPTKFKEGIILNNQIQNAGIDSIARTSSDVIDFARNIYINQAEKKDADSVVVEKFPVADKNFVDQKMYEIVDRQIFSKYCNAKNGNIYQWDTDRNTTEYGLFRGINKRIITCEINSKIEAALLHESFSKDSSIYPYETFTTYANGRYIDKIFEEGKVKGFSSSNGILTIPQIKIHDPSSKFNSESDIYKVSFKYKNTTSQPVEINFINSYVMLNGIRYELGRYGKETISWSSYNNLNQNVFAGEKNDFRSKLKFNPGQKFEGEFKMVIPGLTRLTEVDMNNLVVQLDGITCDGFKMVTYYDVNKKAE